MDELVKIPTLNLEEVTSEGNESFCRGENITPAVRVAVGTKEVKNSIRDEAIDYKTRTKRHTERDNEILIGDQVPREAIETPEGFVLLESVQESFSLTDFIPVDKKKKHEPGSHLAEEIRNDNSASVTDVSRSSPNAELRLDEPPKTILKSTNVNAYEKDNKILPSHETTIAKLKEQNYQLIEALLRTQKNHDGEKRRFQEILFGLDKALSSLPIRLEKIRLRNQRNLSMISSSSFTSGDVSVKVVSGTESTYSEETTSSHESGCYLSIRMKCLLKKMNQLNELIQTIKQDDTSPIELLVNSELYAISLLKKEIKSTKKQIDDNKTDTDTLTSYRVSSKGESSGDFPSKAKNSFSNALNNASNFKIFENHMILQEEALNLLTRKIKETEAELLKEMEANESLRKENETMAKEISRLKSAEEEAKGEKLQKTETLKAIAEEAGNRPYRMIKELKAKLDEKEKTLISWKSKYSRLESVNSHKTTLLENEKKKNSELDATVKSLQNQVKSVTVNLRSAEYVNHQLKDQCELLKSQLEMFANDVLERKRVSFTRNLGMEEQITELSEKLRVEQEKTRKAEKVVQEMKKTFEAQLAAVESNWLLSHIKNEEFCSAFKELLRIVHNFGVKKEDHSPRHKSYNRIREILQMTSSDLDILLRVCGDDSTKEVDDLYEEFKSIVDGKENFSPVLSNWFFDIIRKKLLLDSSPRNPVHHGKT